MRREERVTVQGPVKEQQPDGVSHGGGGGGHHAHGTAVRQVVDDRRAAEVCGQRKPSNNPRNNQHNPQYGNYWAPLTHKRHIPPHSAQPQHTNYWAPRTRKRHQQEHGPQRPTERSDPTQHAKGRTGDCPGPRKGATTRRTVTRGGGVIMGPLWPLTVHSGPVWTGQAHNSPSPHPTRPRQVPQIWDPHILFASESDIPAEKVVLSRCKKKMGVRPCPPPSPIHESPA